MLRLKQKTFLFDDPLPAPACHASTIVKLQNGTMAAAWFAGTREGEPDTLIWLSLLENGTWTLPRPVTPDAGIQHWNPVLFERSDGLLHLYYKVGNPIPDWHTRLITSADGGHSWSEPRELFPGDRSGGRGPVKNKILRLRSGRLLAPASTEQGAWRCFIDVSDDEGRTWEKHPIPVEGPDAEKTNVIQPTLWEDENGAVHALMRSNQHRLFRSDSADGGLTWAPAYPTAMPNNNSGVDLVRLESGRIVLACNPTDEDWGLRCPLTLFVSEDNGDTFQRVMDLETEPCTSGYCYPAIIEDAGQIHLTYTWDRKKIVHCVLEDR